LGSVFTVGGNKAGVTNNRRAAMDEKEPKILVYVNDIPQLVGAVDLSLGYYDYGVHFAMNPEEVCDTLRRHHVELVISDLSTISTDRGALLKRVQQLSPAARIMVLTEERGSKDVAVEGAAMPEYFLLNPGFLEGHIQ
jgi:DNA-binding NtrC family response regulator